MPDITAARPVAGQPIETAWGDQVHDTLEGLQAGSATVAISASSLSAVATVTFPRAYATPPTVVAVGATGPHYYATLVTTPTTTQVQIQMRRGDGSNQTGTLAFHWMALGTPA